MRLLSPRSFAGPAFSLGYLLVRRVTRGLRWRSAGYCLRGWHAGFRFAMFLAGVAKPCVPRCSSSCWSLGALGARAVLRDATRFWPREARTPHRPPVAMDAGPHRLRRLGFRARLLLATVPRTCSSIARWRHGAGRGLRRNRRDAPSEGWIVAASLTSPACSTLGVSPAEKFVDRVLVAAHIELVIAITTLLGITALVRRLPPRADPRLVWVARLRFPACCPIRAAAALTTSALWESRLRSRSGAVSNA